MLIVTYVPLMLIVVMLSGPHDTQHNDFSITIRKCKTQHSPNQCLCRLLLSVVIKSTMPSVVMLNVVMLNAVMLNVVAPKFVPLCLDVDKLIKLVLWLQFC